MKYAERIVLVLLFLILAGGGAWFYFAVQHSVETEQEEMRAAVARGDYELPADREWEIKPEDWRAIYPVTYPITIGGVAVEASVADTLSTRIKGLSDTPFLPDHVVKLFVFGVEGDHSIWMKDMNYPLDIMWVTREGEIVHIEEDVQPSTYSRENPMASQNFRSPVPSWYVIEANAGFVASNTISVGDEVVLPTAQ
ncbi:MAG: DUF192 domain-containing protein [Candidatus Kaiserbacteria bacterium]|nr:DUF192 domain-containing protein [Candidatus Kaiserbacteria bacterium]MCB9816771.1 DUF192 domain-containing protein [Candidatus Nomurabacteria bacterium]